jgi:hypothetical protein
VGRPVTSFLSAGQASGAGGGGQEWGPSGRSGAAALAAPLGVICVVVVPRFVWSLLIWPEESQSRAKKTSYFERGARM